MIELVHVGPNLLPIPSTLGGAIEKRIWQLATAQKELGLEVAVAALAKGAIDANGPRVIEFPVRNRWRFSRAVTRWLLENSPRIVHCHSRPEIAWMLKRQGFAGLVVLSFDFPLMLGRFVGRLSDGYRHWPAKSIISAPDLYLPVTDYAARCIGAFGAILPADSTRVLWNGVEVAASLDDRFSQQSSPLALFVGRLVPQKGVDLLVRASELLPGWSFSAIGPVGSFHAPNGKFPESLGRVRHLGQLQDTEVAAWMRRASCVAVPTRQWEMFGMALVEGLACGTPVVAPAAGGPLELLDGAPAVRFFVPGDPESLSEAVAACVNISLDERRDGQDFAKRFAWNRIAQASIVHYETVGRLKVRRV